MDRLGGALIVIGIILLVSPLYMPAAATIYLIDPAEVWNLPLTPGGTPESPEVLTGSLTTVPFSGSFTFSTNSWSLPGTCSDHIVRAKVYDGTTLKTTVTWSGSSEIFSRQGTCELLIKSVLIAGTFENNKRYTVKWQLEVRQSGQSLGTIDKPQDTAFIIRNVPTVKWFINDVEATPSSTLIATPPLRFKMIVVSGDANIIERVGVRVVKGTNTLADLTLSKTGTSTWEVTWQTNERGRISVMGYFVIQNVQYSTLNMALDLGGGGEGGGGLAGLTPLQLVGLVSLLAGVAILVMRRD